MQKFRKYGLVVLSTNETELQNWELLHNRISEKNACSNADGCCGHCNTVFEVMGWFYLYCLCQEAQPALTEEEFQRGTKKGEMDEMQKQYIEEKCYTVVEMREC